jgi:hypothetical protein
VLVLSSIDFSKLIPELGQWNNGDGISVEAWINCMGSFELAIGFSVLFWPYFVEHEGCVFFGGFSEESYRGFMQACGGDRRRVEAVMNHRHLSDLFCKPEDSATEQQLLYLGRVLKDIWQTKLTRDFPERKFVVSFEEGPREDPIEYEITFRQE